MDTSPDSPPDRPFALPAVSPVGVFESPAGFESTPRRRSAAWRWLAAALLALVALTTVLTTVGSLGGYCLTTEPGDVRSLPAALARHPAGAGHRR